MDTLDELDALNDDAPELSTPAVAPLEESDPLAALDAANEGARETAQDIVNVRAPDGSFQTIARADLPQAEQGGYVPATEADFLAEQERQYAESGLGIAQTAAEQAVQGATLGGYGLAAGAIDDGYGERMEQRAEVNPGTALTAQVAGSLAPILLSGGTGAVARGAALAPAALTERAGLAVGRQFATKLGSGLGARMAARTAESAAEAGLSATAIELSERLPDVVEDPDKWGEQLVAGVQSVGTAALLGAGGGLILGGLGELLSDAAKSAGIRAAKNVERAEKRVTAAQRVTDDNYMDVAMELQARPIVSTVADDTRTALQRKVEQVAAAEGGFEDAQQAAVREITDDLDSALADLNQIDEFAGLRAKTAQTKFLEDAQQGFKIGTEDTDAFIDQLVGDIKQMTSSKGYGKAALQDGGGNTAFARVLEQAKHAKGKIAEYAAKGDLGAMHDEMAQLNRVIGKARANRNTLAAKYLGDVYENQRQFLSDDGLWGSMAQRQKAINEPWSERIRRQRDERIQGFFVRKSGEAAADPFEDLTKANAKTVGSMLNDLGSAESEKSTEPALREFLRAMAADATARANALGADVLRDRAVNVTRRVAAIEEMLDQTKRIRLDAEAGRKQLRRSGALDLASSTAGVLSPTLGFALSGVARIKNTVVRALAEQGGLTAGRVAKAANGFVRSASTAGSKVSLAASRATGQPAAIVSAKLFTDAMDQAKALQDPDSELSRDVIADAEVMDEIQPGLGTAYARTEMARAQFIASKLPPTASKSLLAKQPGMDPVSERKLQKYVAAAYFPQKALDRMASGKSTSEDREVLRILYPKLFTSFVAQVEQQLSTARKAPSYEQRVRIAQQTGLVTMPSTDPANIQALQAIADDNAREAKEAMAGKPQDPTADASKYRAGGDPNMVYGSRSDQILTRR